jgi:hypothetical protein
MFSFAGNTKGEAIGLMKRFGSFDRDRSTIAVGATGEPPSRASREGRLACHSASGSNLSNLVKVRLSVLGRLAAFVGIVFKTEGVA